jgi:mannose-6-phosphate isomerase-like protein (cupin superfamily)
MLQANQTLAVANGSGEARWWFGCLAEIKATATDTGGAFTIVEVTCGPGYEAPLHVHHREDEGFWVLDGRVTLEVGTTTFEAGAGDYAFGPRGLPHRYKVGDQGCRMLFILTPGGFEDLIRATSVPARTRTVPSHDGPPPDMERIKAIVATYGCELLA